MTNRFNLKIHPGHIIPQNSKKLTFFTSLVNFTILFILLYFYFIVFLFI